jgi:thiamine kinase-like enzyme
LVRQTNQGTKRPGNILLSFSEPEYLDRICVIDWEFAMAAPAFIDVGNFIGEVFLIHYFESNDAVYIYLLESFLQAYQNLANKLEVDKIMGYAGAHITLALPRRIKSPRSRATLRKATPCLRHAIQFIADPDPMLERLAGRGEVFENLLQIMRCCRQNMN